jgi:hypothetical protein
VVAAQMAAKPYEEACRKGKAPPDGNVLTNVLRGIHENFVRARAMVHQLTGE